jgi:putative ABC transport system permease protein
VRSTQDLGGAASVVRTVRAAVARIDPGVPVDEALAMRTRVATSLARPRFFAALAGLFALTTFALAMAGVYGVVAYGVARRTRELGIRRALGAPERSLLGLVLRRGGRLAVLGALAGCGVALVVARFIADLLYELRPTDPSTFVVVVLSVVSAALLASYLPARRAMRIDPSTALRTEQ